MQIRLERTGGFGGIKLIKQLDTNNVSKSDSKRIIELLKQALEKPKHNKGNDRFNFKILADQKEVEFGEGVNNHLIEILMTLGTQP